MVKLKLLIRKFINHFSDAWYMDSKILPKKNTKYSERGCPRFSDVRQKSLIPSKFPQTNEARIISESKTFFRQENPKDKAKVYIIVVNL